MVVVGSTTWASSAVSVRKASITTRKGTPARARATVADSGSWLAGLALSTTATRMGGSAPRISSPRSGSSSVRAPAFSGRFTHEVSKPPRLWK